MNKKNALFLLFLVWPFSGLISGVKYFEYPFGRRLLVMFFAFMGLTSLPVGDLDRYKERFYFESDMSLSEAFGYVFGFVEGKSFVLLGNVFFGPILSFHNFIFAIYFGFFGYFLVQTIYQIHKYVNVKKHSLFGDVFFISVILFYSIRTIGNFAFFSGLIFIIYHLFNYTKSLNKKHLYLLGIAPFFHVGLIVFLIIPVFILLFKNKIIPSIIFFILFSLVPFNSILPFVQSNNSILEGTAVESKYQSYGTSDAKERMDLRYEIRNAGHNWKLRTLEIFDFFAKRILIPFGLFLVFIYRKKLLSNSTLKVFFSICILLLGLSNQMLYFSQGERYVYISSFFGIVLFFLIFSTNRFNTIFLNYLKILVPVSLGYGVMALIATHEIMSIYFFVSNFFIEFVRITMS